MSAINWQGVYPAVTTKFDSDLKIDLDAMSEHLEFQLDAGADGIILLGSLGENATLSTGEKMSVVAHMAKAINGRVPLVTCIAEAGTREACDFAKQAANAGSDGFMLLPPMRYQGDEEETVAFLNAVADATDCEIMLYNNPIAYGTDISPELFARLAENPKFKAIKESSADTRRIIDIRNLTGDRYAIFCGVDDLAVECLAVGAVGWVAGLVVAFPKETVAIYRLMQEGRVEEAREIYEWFMPLLHLDVGHKFVQQIKLVEDLMGVGSELVRAPRQILKGAERAHVEQVLKNALENRPKL